MDLAHRWLTPDFTYLFIFGRGVNCVSYDICVYHFWFCLGVFFPGVFLHSRATGACPVTTDLVMRVNVRTTTTISCGNVPIKSPINASTNSPTNAPPTPTAVGGSF